MGLLARLSMDGTATELAFVSDEIAELRRLASPAGVEPATLCLGSTCSIQLSYGDRFAGAVLFLARPLCNHIAPTSRFRREIWVLG